MVYMFYVLLFSFLFFSLFFYKIQNCKHFRTLIFFKHLLFNGLYYFIVLLYMNYLKCSYCWMLFVSVILLVRITEWRTFSNRNLRCVFDKFPKAGYFQEVLQFLCKGNLTKAGIGKLFFPSRSTQSVTIGLSLPYRLFLLVRWFNLSGP